jgi:2-polyprenyl-6-hydroxyphenyl methylase/3-demethylubiquinone-9 3-methyltransferase
MQKKEPIPGSKGKFSFGKNWLNFWEKSFSEQILSESVKSLAGFLDDFSLRDKTFLDVGCGSGIHSLSALKLGAKSVVSFDADSDSVLCTEKVRDYSKIKESDWLVKKGSILDDNFIGSLGNFDVIYCWGVAHHTGDMWQALDNLSKLVKSGGGIFLAIYNKVEGKVGSKMWYRIKRSYNHAPHLFKKIMEYVYVAYSFLLLLIKFNNPFRVIYDYKNKRGMSWKTDLVDWLGGYPYEYASVKDIFDFFQEKGFVLDKIKTTNYIGCNQFLFIKK